MKKLIFIFCTLIALTFISYNISFAQYPSIEWDKTIGGDLRDFGTSLIATSDGGFLLGGISSSNISGDKSEDSRGNIDYWIVKFDKNEFKEWDKTYGGNNYDYLQKIIKTQDGGYLLGGYSNSNKSGEKSENCRGKRDMWILKLDANGNIIWDKTYGGDDRDELYSVIQTNNGGYLLTGLSYSNISGEKTENARGSNDWWIIKIDNNGQKIWDKTIGGSGADLCAAAIQLEDGEYLLGGSSGSNISGEKTEDSFGNGDIWIVKISNDGSILWDKTIGSSMNDYCTSMIKCTDNNYLLGGVYNHNDYGIQKIDSDGTLIWERTMGGASGIGALFSIFQCYDGGFLLGGYSNSNISNEKTENSRGFADYWIVKTDFNGNLIWDKTLGGDKNDQCYSVVQLNDGGYLAAGWSVSGISGEKTADYDDYDAWIVKLNESNLSPIANDDNYEMFGNTLTLSAPGVLSNDTDADSDPLTAVIETQPTKGTVVLNADGSFTYAIGANFDGNDSFTYKAKDGTDNSNVAAVNIKHMLYVTNLNDAGDGSLRWTIDNANSHSGADEIRFAVAGTINVLSQLPTLSDATGGTIINGYSAPGYSGAPVVVLDGSTTNGILPAACGLEITSDKNEVRALQIYSFDSDGIHLHADYGYSPSENSIVGCYIGTDGTTAFGNGGQSSNIYAGIRSDLDADNNQIGTNGDGVNDLLERNVISGNPGSGIILSGSDNIIAGNYIGTDKSGTFAIPNGSENNSANAITLYRSGNRIGTDGNGIADDDEGNLISGNNANGVGLSYSGENIVAGNFIGTNASGTATIPNSGIGIWNSGLNDRIGTNGDGIADDQERNIISGNNSAGIRIEWAIVAGNFIGTDVTGTIDLGNDRVGIEVLSYAKNARIGTNADGIADDAERNIVSGNSGGISTGGGNTNVIVGNFIGTDVTGMHALGNDGVGVSIHYGSRVGTNGDGVNDEIERNVICATNGVGVAISGPNAIVSGNYIGVASDGITPLGNSSYGVTLALSSTTNNIIGGTTSNSGNIIAYSGDDGIVVGNGTGTKNAIRRNTIFSNNGLGIDIYPNGVMLNDPSDADIGPNNLQNFPELIVISADAANTTIEGTLNSTPSTTFTIEFFSNSVADPSGYGEGENYIGTATVTTDGNGDASFTEILPVIITEGEFITATATDPDGNTSEFSAAFEYIACEPPVAVCQDITIQLDINGQAGIAVSDIDNGSEASCGLDNISIDQISFDCSNIGQNIVTLSVTDTRQASSTCNSTVTVNDVTAPVADVALLPDATGECEVTVTAPTATDNCEGTITAATDDPLTYSEQGTYSVNWIYDDGNGNTSSQEQTVVVDDITAPIADVAELPTVTGECDVTVTAPVADEILVPDAKGECDVVDGLIAYYPFNGNADDESGNENDGILYGPVLMPDRFNTPNSSYYFDGTNDIIDIGNNVKPVFPVTVSVWVKVDNLKLAGIFRNDKYDSDYARYGLTLFIENGKISGNYYEGVSSSYNRVNKVSNEVVVTDNNWHHFLVVFNGHEDIDLFWDGTRIDGYYLGTGSGMTYSDGSGVIGHYTTSSNQYKENYFSGQLDDIRVYNRALSEQEIQKLFSGCNTTVTAPTATDNCKGTITATTADPLTYSEQGTFTVNWTYDDGNGNASSQEQTVIVDDVTAPVADVATLPTVSGECIALVTAPTATDNCEGTINATTTDPTEYTEQGTYTVTWTYDDGNGNTSSQQQIVVVDDVTAPVVDIATLPTFTWDCSSSLLTPSAFDNCSGTISGKTDLTSLDNPGNHTVIWTYDDGNGNTTTQEQTIIVTNPHYQDWLQKGTIMSGNNWDYKRFGYSVSTSNDGNTWIAGSVDWGQDAVNHVKVFTWNNNDWQQKGSSINGIGDLFGYSVSISADGNIIAAGAPNGNRVCVFVWNGSDWMQKGNDITGGGGRFGHSIELSSDGNTVAVGANDYTVGGLRLAGQVRVYSWNGTEWIQKGVNLNGEVSYSRFGHSVVISSDGNCIAAGGHGGTGRVRIYNWNGTEWIQKGSTIYGEHSNDRSGDGLSMSSNGNIIAIGAGDNADNGPYSGHVRVFEWNGTDWTQRGEDIDGKAAYDQSGKSPSLSADGNILAIDSQGNDDNGEMSGQVRVFNWNGSEWVQNGEDINGEEPDDILGKSVTLNANGNIMAVGSDTYKNGGFVKIFSIQSVCLPVAVCKNTTVQLNADGVAVLNPMDVDNGSSGDNITLSVLPDIFDCGNVGENVVTLVVTDENGNTTTCESTVTVEDNDTPISDVTTLPTITGECSATAVAPTATDNCEGTITATTTDPTEYTEQGTYTITWSYDDGNGNSTTQNQAVVVDDVTAPVADVEILPNATGECEVTVTAPTASDNCEGTITATTIDPVYYDAQGTYVITWTYDDGNGNSTIQNQTVVVDDVTTPVADVETLPDATGECEVTVTAPTATDNCAGTVTATTADPTVYTTQGTYTVTWTYDDGNENISSQTQAVIVADVTAPVADVALLPDATGECEVTVTAPTATDNCEGTITAVTADPTEYTEQGTFTVNWTYDDGNGNSSSQTQTVVVDDVTAPVVLPKNVTVQLDDNGTASIAASDVDNGSFDNCEIASLNISQENFSCENIGDNTVTLTVTDIAGNQSSDIAIVTIVYGTYEISNVNGPEHPLSLGASASLVINLTAPVNADVKVIWDDGLENIYDGSTEIIYADHIYQTPGVYSVTVQIEDPCSQSKAFVYNYIVIYDPDGGFVTGGGWIESPEGAYKPDPLLTGKANFGFVAKYKKGSTTPDGKTEFQYKAGNLNFNSAEYEYLTINIAGAKAIIKGSGTINRSGNYGFMLSAIDADLTPSAENDKFRIKIWDKDMDVIVYDNNIEGDDNDDPATEINGGSITIHKSNDKSAEIISPAEYTDLKVYPNPFSKVLQFEFISPEDTHARIDLYDATCRKVRTLFDNAVKGGVSYNAEFKPDSEVSGMYFYRMTLGEAVFNDVVIYRKE